MSAKRGPSSHDGRSTGDGADGFTLLDALAALAILGLVMTVVPRGFAVARQLGERSGEWLEARLVAQAVFERELTGRSLRPGAYGGVIAARAWRAVLVPRPGFDKAKRGEDGPDHALLDAHLTVAMAGRPLELDTLLIGVLP